MCRARKQTGEVDKMPKSGKVRTVQEGIQDSGEHSLVLNQVISKMGEPIRVEVQLDGHPLSMELDTRAAASLISVKTNHALFPDMPLLECATTLSTYSGEPLKVVGQREVKVCVDGQEKLPLVVVEGDGCSLFGRNWLRMIRLDWGAICPVKRRQLMDVLEEYKHVFESGLGTLKGYTAKIVVDPNATPWYSKA